MPSVDEATTFKSELAGDLAAGVQTLSLNQEVVFTKYIRVVIPVDGFVFWVRGDLLSPSAVTTAQSGYRAYPQTITAKGSLHYATDTQQLQEETLSINKVQFTSLREILSLNLIGPNVVFIGSFDGIRFSFSSRSNFYKQADLYHYFGDATYADMQSQIIDDLDGFSGSELVVSNSLPAWLSLNAYEPFYGFKNPVQLYPSYLLQTNLQPPFASVHIPPDSTEAIAGTPLLGPTMSSSSLTRDRVEITLWGLRNADAQQFVNCVLQWSRDFGIVGVMNQPVIRDEKRVQSELNAIAQKKTVVFEVNYYQAATFDLARKLIVDCVPGYIFAA